MSPSGMPDGLGSESSEEELTVAGRSECSLMSVGDDRNCSRNRLLQQFVGFVSWRFGSGGEERVRRRPKSLEELRRRNLEGLLAENIVDFIFKGGNRFPR